MDLEEFRVKAGKEKDDLVTFLNMVEERPPDGLPDVIGTADRLVWLETDCLLCANCCKTMTPSFTKDDITRIATHLRMKPATFKEKWLKLEPKSGHWVNVTQPCQFLQPDNKCSIYAVRPADCAEFPHHDKQFGLYNDTFKKNVVHCPATNLLVRKMREVVGM